jgi:hypothetical protein
MNFQYVVVLWPDTMFCLDETNESDSYVRYRNELDSIVRLVTERPARLQRNREDGKTEDFVSSEKGKSQTLSRVGEERPQSMPTWDRRNQDMTVSPIVWTTLPSGSTKLVLSIPSRITLVHCSRHNLFLKHVYGKDAVEAETPFPSLISLAY